jgi:hypothetical protein
MIVQVAALGHGLQEDAEFCRLLHYTVEQLGGGEGCSHAGTGIVAIGSRRGGIGVMRDGAGGQRYRKRG